MNEWNILEALVIKRKSFTQENEIRAVTSLPDDHLGEKVVSEEDKERESQPFKTAYSKSQSAH
jgi:hypothetical protein